MSAALVALGSNLGDPIGTLRAALGELSRLSRSRLVECSSLYRSAPVGLRNQPDFINAVAHLETELGAGEFLDALFAIEARFGRRRDTPHAPRTLDLDLLLFGDTVSSDPRLTLPHPRMHERAFVLMPLVEIAPNCEIPGHGPAKSLLARCAGQRIALLDD